MSPSLTAILLRLYSTDHLSGVVALLHLQRRAFLCRCSGYIITVMTKLQSCLCLSKSAVLARVPALNCKLLVKDGPYLIEKLL